MQGSEILFNPKSGEKPNQATFKDSDERGLRTADCTKYSIREQQQTRERKTGLASPQSSSSLSFFLLSLPLEDQIEKLGASKGGYPYGWIHRRSFRTRI